MKIKKTIKDYYYKMTLNELKLMNHDEDEWDISYNSLLYLDLISMTPQCTGSILAELLGISKSAVTLKINELIKQNLVVKERSEVDRRVYYLRTSEENEKYYAMYDRSLDSAIKSIKNKYSEKELDVFCSILTDINKEYLKEKNEE